MAYMIDGLCPTGGMGGYAFCVHLSPQFKENVAKSGIDAEGAQRVIDTFGDQWLTKCGFGQYFDPENCTLHQDKRQIPSKKTRLSYHRKIRLSWGNWGPEHISVPGNACGLDIDADAFGCVYKEGAILQPHNIDHWGQVNLLLIVFTWFAYSITLFEESREI